MRAAFVFFKAKKRAILGVFGIKLVRKAAIISTRAAVAHSAALHGAD